ncbi:MAG: hypothetical protein IPH20_20590 [Bacteroidales bacterium]|nr:hypothetical protein [Bacteroidales bacterium]
MCSITVRQKQAAYGQWFFAQKINLLKIGTLSYQNGIAGCCRIDPKLDRGIIGRYMDDLCLCQCSQYKAEEKKA